MGAGTRVSGCCTCAIIDLHGCVRKEISSTKGQIHIASVRHSGVRGRGGVRCVLVITDPLSALYSGLYMGGTHDVN